MYNKEISDQKTDMSQRKDEEHENRSPSPTCHEEFCDGLPKTSEESTILDIDGVCSEDLANNLCPRKQVDEETRMGGIIEDVDDEKFAKTLYEMYGSHYTEIASVRA